MPHRANWNASYIFYTLLDMTQTSQGIGYDGYDDIQMLRVTLWYNATIWQLKDFTDLGLVIISVNWCVAIIW